MRLGKKGLIASMALSLCLGAGIAFGELTANSDSKTTNFTTDSCLVLGWGDNSLDDADSIAIGSTIYRYVATGDTASASASGKIYVKFTVVVGEGANDALTGLKVEVKKSDKPFTEDFTSTDGTVEAVGTAMTNIASGSYVYDEITFSNGTVPTVYYAIALTNEGGLAQGKTLAGQVKINQSTTAPAVGA